MRSAEAVFFGSQRIKIYIIKEMGEGSWGETKHSGLSSQTGPESDESSWKRGAETTHFIFLCSFRPCETKREPELIPVLSSCL